MFRPFVVVLLLVVGLGGMQAQKPAGDPQWMVDAASRRQALIEKNGPGNDAALRDRLIRMRDADQDARGISKGQAKDKQKMQIASNMGEIDAQLTAGLKEIVAKSGWPTIATVGIDASNGAMLVLTHTTDHAWQLSLTPLLTKLADEDRIDGVPLAFMIDKELVSEGKLQRYGTQFKYTGDGMAMYGVENPGGLDADRAKIGLPPMDVYRQQLESLYHLKVTGKVAMAVAQPATPAAAPAK